MIGLFYSLVATANIGGIIQGETHRTPQTICHAEWPGSGTVVMVRLKYNLTRPSSAMASGLITKLALGVSFWYLPAQRAVSNQAQKPRGPRKSWFGLICVWQESLDPMSRSRISAGTIITLNRSIWPTGHIGSNRRFNGHTLSLSMSPCMVGEFACRFAFCIQALQQDCAWGRSASSSIDLKNCVYDASARGSGLAVEACHLFRRAKATPEYLR